MKNQTEITLNLDGMKDLVSKLKGSFVRVGVLSDGNFREGDDMGNAEIGLIHEFGSETNNVPPRSFLRMPLETHKKELAKAMTSQTAQAHFEKEDYKRFLGVLGEAARGVIDDAFHTGGFGQWPDISERTKEQKGSSAILIDTGELRKSITYDVTVKDGENT